MDQYSAPVSTTAGAPMGRIASVDIVRGSVMVLMALDHVRDFVTNQRFQPEDLSRATVALFATRWITHFCAPAFFLLAGVGIGLSMGRGKSPAEMSRFLAVRGLLLVLLDLTVSDIGWQFGFHLVPMFAIVIWTLGWCMVLMAALVRLPRVAVAALSLAVIGLHNLFDNVQPAQLGALGPLWQLLHVPGFVIPGVLFAAYPLVPWIGVMGIGFVLAGVYEWEAARRRRFLLWAGVVATAAFVLLRATHAYGNPLLWAPQRIPALTAAAFFNVRKYPPSLQFLLMTLGPALVALSLAESARGRITRWLTVYGRVPLFYYVAHIYLAHVVAIALALAQLGEWHRIDVLTGADALPPAYGVGLPGVYLAWALVVVLMYHPCRWYASLKTTRPAWWMKYV